MKVGSYRGGMSSLAGFFFEGVLVMARNRILPTDIRAGRVRAVEGIHQGLRFLYHPVSATRASEIEAGMIAAGKGQAGQGRYLSGEVAKQLTWWDECDDAGMAEITQDAVRELPPMLWDYLISIVRGLAPSEDANVNDADYQEWQALVVRASEESRPVAA